jgi:N-terminal half of MaoC dehydratase
VRRVNVEAEGKVYPSVAFDVTQELVDGFATLFGDRAPVPATLVTAAEFSVIPTIIGDGELGLDFTRVVHGSQAYEYRRPLRVGERLTVTTRLASVKRRGGMGFVTIETELTGGDGELAATARSTMIEREATT